MLTGTFSKLLLHVRRVAERSAEHLKTLSALRERGVSDPARSAGAPELAQAWWFEAPAVPRTGFAKVDANPGMNPQRLSGSVEEVRRARGPADDINII